MKKILYITALALAVLATSCNGGGKDSGSATTSGSAQDTATVQSADSASKEVADAPNVLMPGAVNKAADKSKPQLEAPKVPVTPESATDKLLKEYNAALITLIEAKQKGGNLSDDDVKKFDDLQSELSNLDKSGKLSATQKELFKITTDTYEKLKSK